MEGGISRPENKPLVPTVLGAAEAELRASLDKPFNGSEGIGANSGTESLPAARLKIEPLKPVSPPPILPSLPEKDTG